LYVADNNVIIEPSQARRRKKGNQKNEERTHYVIENTYRRNSDMRACHDVYENKATYAINATMFMIRKAFNENRQQEGSRSNLGNAPRVLRCECPIDRELGLSRPTRSGKRLGNGLTEAELRYLAPGRIPQRSVLVAGNEQVEIGICRVAEEVKMRLTKRATPL